MTVTVTATRTALSRQSSASCAAPSQHVGLMPAPVVYRSLYSTGGSRGVQIYLVNEVRDWIDSLDAATHARVVQAIDLLAEAGPGLGRPLVDTIHGSSIANLKELRPGTVRILFASTHGAPASCWSPGTKPDSGTSGTPKPSR